MAEAARAKKPGEKQAEQAIPLLVLIIWMLMPSSDRVRNMRLATPTWLRMPIPMTDTFANPWSC